MASALPSFSASFSSSAAGASASSSFSSSSSSFSSSFSFFLRAGTVVVRLQRQYLISFPHPALI